MKYTEKQIANAKRNYNSMLRLHTLADYEVEFIGMNTATQRMDFHNREVTRIWNGDVETANYWKKFFLNEEVKRDQKLAESKAKLEANKTASADVLAPIKSIKKLGDFGKWLNDSKNQFRKQHFSKKYTAEAVNAFLATI